MKTRTVAGFTLLELLITIVVLGVLMLLLVPVFQAFLTATTNNYNEQAKADNQRIGDALTSVAKNAGVGRLPAPYTGGGYTSTIYNPADGTALGLAVRQAIADSGVSPVVVNDDGTGTRRARVYQRVTGLTQDMPMYFRSGPLVTLTYDYGVVYLTQCPVGGSCLTGGVPGASPALTAANRNTWAAVSPDQSPVFVSSLPVQTAMLQTTARRVDRVRDALMSYYRGKQLTAAATDTTNWFPGSTLAGRTPASNQGCRDGWYALDSTPVLPIIGLSQQEFGVTAWGGRIEYCADYDPLASKTPNAPPHAAALRFRAAVSSGAAPDPSVLSNNVILTL